MRPRHVLPVVLACLAVTGAAADDRNAPLRAVATIGMVSDVVARVGGECVDGTTLMGPGVDPHLYQASARDVTTLREADIIFYAGYALEGKLGGVLERFDRRKPTVAVSPASTDREDLIRVEGYEGVDPHLWMDVALWARTVPTVAERLAALRPDCAGAMRERADAYGDELAALDAWVREAVASVPEGQRYLVTAHDAFAYFGRAYDLEVIGIQGISTDAEAGVADIRDTVRLVAETGVPALFVESTINPRTVQAVVDALRERGADVTIGGELYSDAMGSEGEAAGTYIGMIHANTRAIVEALGGRLPPLPAELEGWAAEWEM